VETSSTTRSEGSENSSGLVHGSILVELIDMSTWRYSTGLESPRGSNPLSPGKDPSNHPGLSVFGNQRGSAWGRE
jgi:hypothetical protein